MEVKPTGSYLTGCEAVAEELSKYSDWDIKTMTAISMAESGCNPARNNLTASETHRGYDGNVVCVGSYGALQIGCVHYLKNPAGLNDLATNVAVAHSVYLKQGYKAWSVYSSGKYLKYL